MIDPYLSRYCRFFETLRADNLPLLDTVFHPLAVFRDPFNHVQGRDAIRRIFEHLLDRHPRCRFRVTESCANGTTAYIRWTFMPDAGKPLQIEGMSRVAFEPDGTAIEHLDYWDSASGLFARLPLTGPPTRWLLRQAQACRADQLD